MKKIYSIQYLRACAALMVLVAHSFGYQIGPGNFFVKLGGHQGVMLFFVISGFIMVYISGAGPFAAGPFLRRRAIRIVPLYWLFTGLAAFLAALAPSLFQTTVFTWPHFLKSLLFIAHEAPVRGGTSPILSLGWTLNFEVYFYIAFALCAFLSVTGRVALLTAFFATTWLAGLLLAPTSPALQFYLDASPLAFAAGMWIGWLSLKDGIPSGGRPIWALGLVTAAGLTLALADDGTPLMSGLGFAGQIACATGLVLLGLALEPKIGHWRLPEQLGDASYALYLSHIFVVGAVVLVVRRTLGTDGPFAVTLASVGSIVVACAASLLIHRLIEKPILRALNGKRKPARASIPHAVAGAGEGA